MNSSFEERDVTHTVHLKLAVPNYVYTKKIAVEYQSGRVDSITGGFEVHAERLDSKRKVTFYDDGETVYEDLT